MLKINKNPPPEKLLKLQEKAVKKGLNPEKAYSTLKGKDKDEVLESLIKEQGHLCAYCMRRIPDERISPDTVADVSIEHWYPRNPEDNTDIGQGLDYNNLFAVCSGNKNAKGTRKQSDLTCDVSKGSQIIKVNQLNEATLSTIWYSENGEIFSTDPEIESDLHEKLNLNCESDAVRLPEARKAVLDSVQEELSSLCSDETDILENCQYILEQFENEVDPKTPYIGIAIWWLKNYINDIR